MASTDRQTCAMDFYTAPRCRKKQKRGRENQAQGAPGPQLSPGIPGTCSGLDLRDGRQPGRAPTNQGRWCRHRAARPKRGSQRGRLTPAKTGWMLPYRRGISGYTRAVSDRQSRFESCRQQDGAVHSGRALQNHCE